MPLGNPEETEVISVDENGTTITVTQGLSSLEIQNTGSADVAFGKPSTVTFARGILIYANGDRKSWENLPTGWTVRFITAAGKTTTLRRVNYV